MGKRFVAHFGSLDNISQLASMGFTELGYVTQFDGSSTYANIASAIHNAGVPTATINLFNDGSSAPCQIGAAGGTYAGYFGALASAGWNCIAGEGCGGSVVGTAMNYCVYVNYGGIIGDDQAGGMYASPWNHPASGGKGHFDYIETYNNSNGFRPDSAVAMMNNARSNGSKHVGILIGVWMLGVSASQYISVLNGGSGDTVAYWGGYGTPSSGCVGHAQQMIAALGTAKDGSSTATASSGSSGGAAVVSCPCRHIWIGFQGVSGSSTSQKLEFKLRIVGQAGYVDDNDAWIPGRPYTGQLQAWCRNAAGKSWILGNFWPAKDGSFSFEIGSDTIEKRDYNVCFI